MNQLSSVVDSSLQVYNKKTCTYCWRVTRLNLDSGYVVEQFPECAYPIDTHISHIQQLIDIMYLISIHPLEKPRFLGKFPSLHQFNQKQPMVPPVPKPF